MAHTHEYDCRECGAHLDSRQELDAHMRANHPNADQNRQASSGTSSPSQQSPSSRPNR